MAGSKLIVFDANDFVKLLVHYTEGRVPIDAELKSLGVGTRMKRQVGMLLKSEQWPKEELDISGKFYHPLHLRYEGKKVMSWGKKGAEPFWQDQNVTPKLQ